MKHKHIYEAPQAQVLHLDTLNMIAASAKISDETTDDDARMSKKRQQSWNRIWD